LRDVRNSYFVIEQRTEVFPLLILNSSWDEEFLKETSGELGHHSGIPNDACARTRANSKTITTPAILRAVEIVKIRKFG